MKVTVVDYGAGNLLSVKNAVENCGFDVELATTADALAQAERLILPGVGAFAKAMQTLHAQGLVDALHHAVRERKVPILGICLGMQLMAEGSEEGEPVPGLGWLPAKVVRICATETQFKVPHIGWNEVETRQESPLFRGLSRNPLFYFVHSYHVSPRDPALLEATCQYGGAVTAAVRWKNIAATQFHPEKSSQNGLRLLENFLNWVPDGQ